MGVRWRHMGAHVATPRGQWRRRRWGRGSPALCCTVAAGEVRNRTRRRRGTQGAHPHKKAGTEMAGGERRAAARLRLKATRRYGGPPTRARGAAASRRRGDAIGGGGEDPASTAAAQLKLQASGSAASKTSNSASTGRERGSGWWLRDRGDEGLPVLSFIEAGEVRGWRSCARA